MSIDITRYLDDLEARLLPEVEGPLWQAWVDFLDGRFAGAVFTPERLRAVPPAIEWPEVHINDALEDFDQMLLQQYKFCSDRLAGSGRQLPVGVRPNYGTCLLPSLFGVELFIMERQFNTLPTNRPLTRAQIDRALAAGVPAMDSGYFAKVFEMAERFCAVRAAYPNIAKYIMLIHPDFQGPMDVVELLWGSDLFVALYDSPEEIHALLSLVTETYERAMARWLAYFPPTGYVNHNNQFLCKGTLVLRDDSAMNMSRDFFEEFIAPYDGRLLKRFGSGAVHFCGRGDHYIAPLCGLEGVRGINMSQPHYNDLEIIFANTVDKGISLLDFSLTPETRAFVQQYGSRGLVHGVPA